MAEAEVKNRTTAESLPEKQNRPPRTTGGLMAGGREINFG